MGTIWSVPSPPRTVYAANFGRSVRPRLPRGEDSRSTSSPRPGASAADEPDGARDRQGAEFSSGRGGRSRRCPSSRWAASTSSLSVRPTQTVPSPTCSATTELPPSRLTLLAAGRGRTRRAFSGPQSDVEGRDVPAGRAGRRVGHRDPALELRVGQVERSSAAAAAPRPGHRLVHRDHAGPQGGAGPRCLRVLEEAGMSAPTASRTARAARPRRG